MNSKTLASYGLAALLGTASLAAPALAAGGDESQEATALRRAKVSLSEAIATAEQRTGGQAFDAGVDLKGSATRIAVETNGPKGVQTVIVDAQSGQVVGTHPGVEPD